MGVQVLAIFGIKVLHCHFVIIYCGIGNKVPFFVVVRGPLSEDRFWSSCAKYFFERRHASLHFFSTKTVAGC